MVMDLSRRGFGAGLAGLSLAGCSAGPAPEHSFLVNLTDLPQAAAPPAPTLEAGATVGTGADLSGRVTAPVMINGRGPYRFVVDTGANHTVISTELALELGLPDGGRADIHGIAGVEPADTATIARLQVDTSITRNIRAPLLPRARLGAAGLLGVDVLRGHLVTFDFRRNELSIRPANTADLSSFDLRQTAAGVASGLGSDRFVVPAKYRFGQLIIIGADVAGRAVTAFLDSGSQSTVGNLALRRVVLGDDADPRRRRYEVPLLSATGQTAQGELVAMPLLKIGGIRITGLPAVFADLHVFDIWDLAKRPSILMGIDMMQQFDAIQLDYGRRQVVFYPPAQPRRTWTTTP